MVLEKLNKEGYKQHTKDNKRTVEEHTTNNNADMWDWDPYALNRGMLYWKF